MSDLAITLQTSAINPVLGDLEFSDSTISEILLTDDTSYPDGRDVLQDLFICLRTFFGEWFLDKRVGLPYFRFILVHNPDERLIEAIFRRAILSRPGVASLESLTLTFDRPSRTLYPRFVGRLASGKIFKSEDFGAFIVDIGPDVSTG